MAKLLTTTLAAAAFVAAPISVFTPPVAQACASTDTTCIVDCMHQAAQAGSVSGVQACANQQFGPRQNAAPPPAAPGGPCIVSPGLNQNCGQQSNQPGLCMLTGVCQPKQPVGDPPPAPPPPPTAAIQPGEIMPAPAAPPRPPKPVDPGQCGDPAYFGAHEFECAQKAPPPAGFQPGGAG
jgi:hypothetical protein